MYYNEIIQPDGTQCIGINYDEERPTVLEVLPNPELEIQQRVQQPVYQIFDTKIIHWLNLFIIIISVYYVLVYDNMISISNCIACVLPLHSIQNNNLYGIIGYTVYIMFSMLLTTFFGIYEYLWYYVICDSIIICIFITSVAKYIIYIRNQTQNITDHVV
ncbi:hypothetical protein CL646_03685 [bacterium]|nr:hypothetical protein [bacterium]